jgi:hypothetical protein
MSTEEPEERPAPPARIGHEFQEPIVEELPQQPLDPPGEPIDAAQGDNSKKGTPPTASSERASVSDSDREIGVVTDVGRGD